MNPGGIRAGLIPRADGTVTYGDLFAVQPFSNLLVTLTLSGAQIKALLEQQWQDQPMPRILQVSSGFSYSWDASRQPGDRVLADSISLNGVSVRPESRYRVVVPDFLADGGDRMMVLKDSLNRRPVVSDIDAMQSYFAAKTPLSPPSLARIHRLN
jgi:5'-nucleotidase